jgi:hypothetical protein
MKKLLILLAIFLAALVAGALWIRSWLTPTYLREQVETQIKTYFTGQFSLGTIGYQFPLSIQLKEIRVADPTGKDEYLKVALAAATLEPWALLSQEVHVTSFLLKEPSILLALDEKNQLEMMRFVTLPKSSETSSTTSSQIALAVSETHIQEAKITLRQPGQPLRQMNISSARLSLLGETMTLQELSIRALDTLELEAHGKLVKLLSTPSFEDFAVDLKAAMPPGFLDPKVHGKVQGTVLVQGALNATLGNPVGNFQLTSSGLTWIPPDAALRPIETGALVAQLKLKDLTLAISDLKLDLWGGSIHGQGMASAAHSALDLSIKDVVAGSWLGPMLSERGFGPPLPNLTVQAEKVHLTTQVQSFKNLAFQAGGLKVAGDFVFAPQKAGGPLGFGPGSALEGHFAGPDMVTALKIPDTNLEGEIGLKMSFAGSILTPTVKGSLGAPSLKVGRPKVFSLPIKDLTGSFTYDQGKLQVPDLKAQLVGGKLEASTEAQLDAIPPRYSFQMKGLKFEVPAIFKTALVGSPFSKGALDLDFNMAGKGSDLQALKGEGHAVLRMAQFATNPTLKMLAEKLKSPGVASPTLDGKFKLIEVSDGRLRLGDFSGNNGKLGPIQGDGSIGFDKTLQGKVAWKVPLDSPEIPKEIRGKNLPIALTLGGTVEAPVVKVEDIQRALGKMLANEAKARLAAETARAKARLAAEKSKAEAKLRQKAAEKVSKLTGGLLGKLGGGSGSSGNTSGSKPKVPEQIKNKAKGLLRGLFR